MNSSYIDNKYCFAYQVLVFILLNTGFKYQPKEERENKRASSDEPLITASCTCESADTKLNVLFSPCSDPGFGMHFKTTSPAAMLL